MSQESNSTAVFRHRIVADGRAIVVVVELVAS